MALPGFHADASLYRTAHHYAGTVDTSASGGHEVVAAALPSPSRLACMELCVATRIDIRGLGTALGPGDFEAIVRFCAALCAVPYSAQLVRQLLAYVRGIPLVPGTGGGPLPPTAGAGGVGAGTVGAVAFAAVAVAWLIARLIHLPFEEPPLPPDFPPEPLPGPPGQTPAVPCERMLTDYRQHVVGFGITGFLESGCAVADREAYAKAADYCNQNYASACAGACRAGGPCRPDYVPLELRRETALWILGLACNSHLAFHCRCRC